MDVLNPISMEEPIDKKRRLSNLFSPSMLENGHSSSASSEGETLDLNETNIDTEPENSAPTLRRSNRKKIRSEIISEPDRVRKPKRLTDKSSEKEIKKYYLDTNLRLVCNSLETIYEEPQVVNNTEVTMSTRRFKRHIDFNVVVSKFNTKFKKRKAKAKNVRKKKKSKKVSMEFLMEKLKEIDE